MDQDEPASAVLDHRPDLAADRVVGGDRRAYRGAAGGRHSRGDKADPRNVGVAVLAGEAEPLGQVQSDDVAVEQRHPAVTALQQSADEQPGHGRLARSRQTGEHHGEPPLGPRWLCADEFGCDRGRCEHRRQPCSALKEQSQRACPRCARRRSDDDRTEPVGDRDLCPVDDFRGQGRLGLSIVGLSIVGLPVAGGLVICYLIVTYLIVAYRVTGGGPDPDRGVGAEGDRLGQPRHRPDGHQGEHGPNVDQRGERRPQAPHPQVVARIRGIRPTDRSEDHDGVPIGGDGFDAVQVRGMEQAVDPQRGGRRVGWRAPPASEQLRLQRRGGEPQFGVVGVIGQLQSLDDARQRRPDHLGHSQRGDHHAFGVPQRNRHSRARLLGALAGQRMGVTDVDRVPRHAHRAVVAILGHTRAVAARAPAGQQELKVGKLRGRQRQ